MNIGTLDPTVILGLLIAAATILGVAFIIKRGIESSLKLSVLEKEAEEKRWDAKWRASDRKRLTIVPDPNDAA